MQASFILTVSLVLLVNVSCLKRNKGELASAKYLSPVLSQTGTLHAPLGASHDQTAEKFINQHLKKNGIYDSQKISAFILKLEKEKVSLAEDLYETRLIEKIEMEVTSFKKAKKSAKKKKDEKKSVLLRAYTEFMIPKIKQLLELVKVGNKGAEADALVDQFLTIYTVYYLPNATRNILHQDLD